MRPAALEVDRISKRYGELVACSEVSFTAVPGEVFGLVGGPGAGRTTLLRIVLGVLPPDSGTVLLGGEPLTPALRARIGYLPEERGLYPRMRVLDQLVYFAELRGASTDDAHRSAELWLARLGLRAHRTRRVHQLGPGDQQRVQLAAALVHDPDLVVLDEPFAGLDRASADLLGEVLRELAAAGLPVVLASSELDLVEWLCDRVCVLHNGQVITVDSVAALRAGAACELVVDAPGAPAGWADRLPGVRTLYVHNGLTHLALTDGADDQTVLAAALATGPVRGFTRVRPSLAELFRDVVAAE